MSAVVPVAEPVCDARGKQLEGLVYDDGAQTHRHFSIHTHAAAGEQHSHILATDRDTTRRLRSLLERVVRHGDSPADRSEAASLLALLTD